MKSKTIKEWLEELPDGYRERALSYTNEDILDVSYIDSIVDALNAAFTWGNTREGHKFWLEVYEHYGHGCILPFLP